MIEELKTIRKIKGPLIFVEVDDRVKYGEIVKIVDLDIYGKVIQLEGDIAVVQAFGDTLGLNKEGRIYFTKDLMKIRISDQVLGRILNAFGEPLDGGPKIYGEKYDINGIVLNPYKRKMPKNFIETGISVIDVMSTLIRGQKLPIFSAPGINHNELAIQIAKQANVKNEDFYIVLGGMGLNPEEAMYFKKELYRSKGFEKTVLLLNLSSDPAIERLILPRTALTIAEYLAYEKNAHVLVILTDMTKYCYALREVSSYKNEIPGRRAYPGYLYTDLASIYERAGAIKGMNGSITQMPFLTMPNNDITHPIPDLTGYITEGQIVLDKRLVERKIYPPINPLPSLSRLMKSGIGKGKTREDHADVANQLYASYAAALDLRNLISIIGDLDINQNERKLLLFADRFEEEFLKQGKNEYRSIEESLNIAWNILSILPEEELTSIRKEILNKYGVKHGSSQE